VRGWPKLSADAIRKGVNLEVVMLALLADGAEKR
jgi:hypothetical protein